MREGRKNQRIAKWDDGFDHHLGIIVCNGGSGQADFSDERYWVRFARINNADNDNTSKLSFAPDGTKAIVCATDLLEHNHGTHLLTPGTPVICFKSYARDGTCRWMLIAADETDTGQTCGSGSGSGGNCMVLWTAKCSDSPAGGWNHTAAPACGNVWGYPVGAWTQIGFGANPVWVYVEDTGSTCASVGGTCSVGMGTYPGDPPATCGSGSGGNNCMVLYTAVCSDSAAGGWNHTEDSACGNFWGYPVGAWTQVGANWFYVLDTGHTCASEGQVCSEGLGEYPGDPPASCGSGSGGSGSGAPPGFCYYQYQRTYNDAWGDVSGVRSWCAPSQGAPPPALNTWVQAPGSDCIAYYYIQGDACDGTDQGGCDGDWPASPTTLPGWTPTDCGGGSGSGSGCGPCLTCPNDGNSYVAVWSGTSWTCWQLPGGCPSGSGSGS